MKFMVLLYSVHEKDSFFWNPRMMRETIPSQVDCGTHVKNPDLRVIPHDTWISKF